MKEQLIFLRHFKAHIKIVKAVLQNLLGLRHCTRWNIAWSLETLNSHLVFPFSFFHPMTRTVEYSSLPELVLSFQFITAPESPMCSLCLLFRIQAQWDKVTDQTHFITGSQNQESWPQISNFLLSFDIILTCRQCCQVDYIPIPIPIPVASTGQLVLLIFLTFRTYT